MLEVQPISPRGTRAALKSRRLLYKSAAPVAYSPSEFDTFVRHGIPVIAVVGNDASWRQIAREQVDISHDDVGTTLRHTDYHRVAQGFDAEGLCIRTNEELGPTLRRARELAARRDPVRINAIYPPSDFRRLVVDLAERATV